MPRLVVAGQADDRNTRVVRQRRLRLAELPSVHHGHHQVENDQFGQDRAQHRQRRRSIFRRQRFVPGRAQDGCQQLPQIAVIVHHQDTTAFFERTQLRRCRRIGWVGASCHSHRALEPAARLRTNRVADDRVNTSGSVVNICGSYRSVIVLTPASCANGS